MGQLVGSLRRHADRLTGGHALLAMTIALLAAVGFVLAPHYGSGIDSLRNANVGWNAVQSYWSPARYTAYMQNGDVLAHHGPAYFMVYSVASRILQRVVPGWIAADGRSFTNFLTFLLAAAGLYLILLRIVPRRAALAGMLLFLTQPLLFGHGFINQKDTPFMGFFALSVAVGMTAADHYRREEDARPPQTGGAGGRSPSAPAEWRAVPAWTRLLALAVITAGVLVVLDILVFGRTALALHKEVALAIAGQAGVPWQAWLEAILPSLHEGPPEQVHLRVNLVYWIGRAFVLAGVAAGSIAAAAVVAPRRKARPAGAHRASFGLLLIAGALVGFTIAIRPIGAFAGALVLLYWLGKNRLRGFSGLLLGGLMALLVAYLAWPYLWDAPLRRLTDSFGMTVDFESKETLFRGRMVASDSLPWEYFPTLVSIELTEVAVPLFVLGVAAAMVRSKHARQDRCVLAVLSAWILVPLMALWFLGMGIYNNIKHLHFILVPMIAFAAIGLDAILLRVRGTWLRPIVVALVLLPGIVGIVRLHPYEYTYFNSFVGGARGAVGEYTLDRFCTASRAAMDYVNRVAEKGALISVPGAPFAATEFARPDLQVSGQYGEVVGAADYVVTCSFSLGPPQAAAEWENVLEIARAGVVYSEVWKRVASP